MLSDSFIECIDKSKPDSITRLDDLQLSHHTAFLAVPEYSGCQKPKHMMSANYPVDVLNTGPLVRTWCMTFEAMLQLLKGIASNSNYKDVIKRMATLWSLRTGLELLDEKLAHWSESYVVKKEGNLSVTYRHDKTMEFARDDEGCAFDIDFACKVSSPFPETQYCQRKFQFI